MFFNKRQKRRVELDAEIAKVEAEVQQYKKKIRESVDITSEEAVRLTRTVEKNNFTFAVYKTIGGKK